MKEKSEQKAPAEAVKNANILSWFLFFADLAVGAVLTLLHFCLSVTAGWQYCLLMAMLPLSYLVFIWIYADLMGEGRREDDERRKSHVSVEMRFGILILQNLLSVLPGLTVSMQCVRGGERVFWTGFAIFAVLSMGSVWRLGLKRSKRRVLLSTVVLTGMLCWSLTLTLFLTAAGPKRHHLVEVTRTAHSGGRFSSYYAYILDKYGCEQRILVDGFAYRRLNLGGEALLFTYDSLFDTEFEYLWANPPE